MNLKAFPQPSFDPGHEFRGSKALRRPRRSVVILSHHNEFLPMDVDSDLEQRASLVYFRLSRRARGGHIAKTVYFFIEGVSLPKTHPHPLHAI